jgi:hypothetical protein
MPHEQLQRALATLMRDEQYRGAIASDPDRLARELGVPASDLDILANIGVGGPGAGEIGTGRRIGKCEDVRRIGKCVLG